MVSYRKTLPVIEIMKLETVEKVNIKFGDDQTIMPGITGSLFMPNGELILCDESNSSVYMLDTDLTQKESLSCHPNHGICVSWKLTKLFFHS